jgi:site-specific DNA recombinase
MQAGIYVRISDDREGRGVGVARQEEDCRALAAQRGWEVAGVYSDNDVSATSGRKREGYRRLLADLRAGRLDAIVAYSSSRLYRRMRDLLELIELLDQRGVEVATVASGRIDITTADGRMMAQILAAIDQGEAERIGERSRRAKAEAKANGKWLGGGAGAYGYERVKNEDGKVVAHRIKPEEASVLSEAARRVLAGESLGRVSRDLGWQPSRLRQVLRSPFHAGRYGDGTPGSWPAIFTEDEHLLLRARFPKRETREPRPERRYLLSGIAVCAECGKRLLGSGGSYRCQARNGGCGRVRVAARHLDAHVWDQMMSRPYDEGEPGHLAPPADDSELTAELRAAQARQVELADAFAAGEVGLADFRRASEALERRISAVEEEVRRTAPRRGWGFARLVEEPTVLDRNEFAEEMIERVTVRPALRRGRGAEADIPRRVEITWRPTGS